MKTITMFLCGLMLLATPRIAQADEYNLVIAEETVNITGSPVKKLTINGTIPGPTLHFKEGEDVTVHVTNNLDESTSIHWHGFLIDPAMDGVPGFSGFDSIAPGMAFTYHFKVRQSGTYWYHSHSQFQEQDGLYGAIIVDPETPDSIKADRDYVVVLSDFTDEKGSSIMGNLKMLPDYYNYARRTVGDFFADVKSQGFSKAWENRKMWGEMRMTPTDISDVSGYTFLMNGKTPDQNWTGLFKKGERVRLRFINASAMSIYDVRIPDLEMQIISADGQNVEPVPIDEFRFGVAETYDVIVTPSEDQAYTIAAEPIDRTGFAIGTLAPREGMKGPTPKKRKRALLTMADMKGMMNAMNEDSMEMNHHGMAHDMSNMAPMKSGWADASTPKGHKQLDYSDLRYRGIQKDTRMPERTIEIRLGGNMERYLWTMNGKRYQDSGPMNLRYGERVRLKFVNETMMAHPMHLHGMFVQLENGQPMEKMPNKHTVIVPPGESYSVLLTADEAGEWAFHCHLLYHMAAGMMTKVVVARLDPADIPKDKRTSMKQMNHEMHNMKTEDQHHAH